MSQHPSLVGSQKGKRHRSVLKRHEKLKYLMEKNKWEEKDSIYRLPKVKSIKFKVKKEKAASTETEVPAGQTAPAAAGAKPQAAGARPQQAAAPQGATAKPAAQKQDKKAKA